MFGNWKAYRKIKLSGYFDPAYYLLTYPDVRKADVDPLSHYIAHGWREQRNPARTFDTNYYLKTNPDVRQAGIDPLIHYLSYGQFEGRSTSPINELRSSFGPIAEKQKRANVQSDPFFWKSFVAAVKLKGKMIVGYLKLYGVVGLIKAIVRKFLQLFSKNEHKDSKDSLGMIIPTIDSPTSDDIKKWSKHIARTNLYIFLSSLAVLEFPIYDLPVISIILLFYNRAEMSLQCLETIVASAGHIPFEVIIVDNSSQDETPALLDQIRNAKIIRNSKNLGFGGGCNQAVDLAVGKYLLFLNNDTQLMPNSLSTMVETIETKNNIGAVGGKLIFPDGKLQEAGSIIWQDGSCLGYGRNENPFNPEFSYVKDVDFCSGAMLLTPKDIFITLGKFDPRYEPAYYEDVDYCLKLWSEGYRVVFQPFAIAIHNEFGSSDNTSAIQLQLINREKFKQKWHDYLNNFDLAKTDRIIYSREHKTDSKRILVIDDRIPDYRLGSGLPRTFQILHNLAEMGYKLTFFPMQFQNSIPGITEALERQGIEVLYNESNQKLNLKEFLMSRQDYYDIAFVSRPHNMKDAISHIRDYAPKAVVIYDAEAIFALRDVKYNELIGLHMNKDKKEQMIRTEVNLAANADVVITVSEKERQLFLKFGVASSQVLGHVVDVKQTPASFEERKDILFVGGILGHPTPNEDAVLYFVKEILPLVRAKLNCELFVVGENKVQALWDLASDHVHITGRVDDLTPYYNKCRLFIVPTRYSAGIPLKLIEASAHGLPAVVTPITAEQLGWQENRDILVGHNPIDFAEKIIKLYLNRDIFYLLRQNVLERIHNEYAPNQFRMHLENTINLALHKNASTFRQATPDFPLSKQ